MLRDSSDWRAAGAMWARRSSVWTWPRKGAKRAYTNVKLGQLDTSAKPRLLPAFPDKGWETKPIKPPAN